MVFMSNNSDVAAKSDKIEMRTMGLTDSGKPLHIIVFSENKNFSFILKW